MSIEKWLVKHSIQYCWWSISPTGWLFWLRLGLLTASFYFLLAYGFLTLRTHPLKPGVFVYLGWTALIIYGLGILASAVINYRTGTTLLVNVFDVLTRYLLQLLAAC